MLFTVFAIVIIVICLIFLMLIKPNKRREATSFFAEYKYAHRGLFDNDKAIPENSLSAFRKAKENSFGVELDVQLTADKKVVVFHDGSLKRMCGDDKMLYTLTYDELYNYNLMNTDEKIPLFIDVLSLLGDTPIICEIKIYTSNSDISVCELVTDILKNYHCRLCIESFNPLAVRYFHKNNPNIVRGQLSMNFLKVENGIGKLTGFILKNLLLNIITKPDFIAYRHTDKKCFSFSVCKKLFKPLTFAWTVKSKEEETDSSSFDSIIFEGYIPKEN